ncbi:iron complex transport system substrate-binding protein [Pseudooceanicola antarcticus]|uniref:Iron ABC transporter substrate-binding protein n=1 Tax=Pseudooceanicola antarcticus TaxID=1247613 RepID=A0A285IRD9_9RHOB|nr:siderophore ABC transporter substrate-binding protein [Pseudooceanicola antarcticus]PJE31847.1 iron ABC transporter substrate-binding protein [Pseudooceanicola antarcticus]SNY50558.1 iron complex transport system substrate-binding protein [Pseudooceanicola antarcticus]
MRLFHTPILSAIAAAALSAAAAHAEPASLATVDGPLELPAAPRTIVAFEMAAVDTLAALGHAPAGVPEPLYVADIAAQVPDATPAGSLFEPDFETVAAMQPDLVIVGARSLKQKEALSKIAPVANMSVGADAITDGLAHLEAYGALLGEEEKAAALTSRIETALAEAKAAVAEKGGKALILLTNGPKISTYGAGSRFGWLHGALDWPEASEGIEAATHGEAVSFEFVADVNPDTLIVIDRGTAVNPDAQSGRVTLDNPLVHNTKAWKEGRVLFLSAPEIYISSGGAGSMLTTLTEISDGLAE